MKSTQEQVAAHAEFNEQVAKRQAEQVAAARQSKAFHEETLAERDARHQAEIAAATAAAQPTPEQIRAANLAQERACRAVDEWAQAEENGEDRYEPTIENQAAITAAINTIHGGVWTAANLAAALDYCIAKRLIVVKKKAAKDPQTAAEWAVVLGYSLDKIQNHTSAARIRELRKDPFHRQIIDWVIANRFNPGGEQ